MTYFTFRSTRCPGSSHDELSRRFVIRHDYDAYEYTVYVYRSPSRS